MKSIPVDQLKNKTSAGLQIKVFKHGDEHQSQTGSSGAHRDDHYIFFLLTNGSGTLTVDMQDIEVCAGELYFVLPTQVHSRVKTKGAAGWFLAVDISLIPTNLKAVFERRQSLQLPCKLTPRELKQYSNLLSLLLYQFTRRPNDAYYLPIIHTLAQSFLAMAASAFNTVQTTAGKHNRPAELARQFKNLLAAHIYTIKSPSAYAAKLHVSQGYLNEVIKQATGSTVSYWIQQEIFSEAKRLLYHSDADIKQIAYELGYSDHSYFVRFFRKASGLSPLKFRMLNRK